MKALISEGIFSEAPGGCVTKSVGEPNFLRRTHVKLLSSFFDDAFQPLLHGLPLPRKRLVPFAEYGDERLMAEAGELCCLRDAAARLAQSLPDELSLKIVNRPEEAKVLFVKGVSEGRRMTTREH